MSLGRSRYGLAVSALGALALMVGLFLPWYEVALAPAGASALLEHGQPVLVRSLLALTGGTPSTGTAVATLSAREAFGVLSAIVLVAGCLSLLDALLGLAQTGTAAPGGAGQAVVPLGLLAAACVVYRMAVPPSSLGPGLSVSLRAGAWLSLAGAGLVALGGAWPGPLQETGAAEPAGAPGMGSALGRLG
jgi:hypothetical protein